MTKFQLIEELIIKLQDENYEEVVNLAALYVKTDFGDGKSEEEKIRHITESITKVSDYFQEMKKLKESLRNQGQRLRRLTNEMEECRNLCVDFAKNNDVPYEKRLLKLREGLEKLKKNSP